MQVVVLDVDPLPPLGILDVRVPNRPLARDLPVERGGAGRHLVRLQRHEFAHDPQGFAHPIAGYAAMDRKQALRKSIKLLPA